MFFEYEEEEKKPILEYISIINDELIIPSHEWKKLLKHYTKKEIQDALTNTVVENDLPFPLYVYTKSEIELDWANVQNVHPEYYPTEWLANRQASDLPFTYKGKNVCIRGNFHGQKVSNQFSQLARMECGYHSGNSPMYEWKNCNKRKNNFTRCFFGINEFIIDRHGVSNNVIRSSLRLHTYMAGQFKPSVAKFLYNFFNAKNVLDFSMGWGDRLVGFLASNAESYVGIDPNTKLHEPYKQIASYCNTDKTTRFICSPAEDADLTGVKVDFVFTSPPYFDIERYSEEETQSWKRYSEVDLWVEGFLCKTLKKCWDALEEGGRICVNIADKKGSNICEPMIEYMKSLGATYEGVIGYEMMKRPGNKIDEVFCEPIWIWSKGEAKEPNWNHNLFFS